jgi:hypothetical protein
MPVRSKGRVQTKRDTGPPEWGFGVGPRLTEAYSADWQADIHTKCHKYRSDLQKLRAGDTPKFKEESVPINTI